MPPQQVVKHYRGYTLSNAKHMYLTNDYAQINDDYTHQAYRVVYKSVTKSLLAPDAKI